jgi:hypothetical protein
LTIEEQKTPAADAATRIADKYLAGHSIEERRACALEIFDAIVDVAIKLTAEAVREALCIVREESPTGDTKH